MSLNILVIDDSSVARKMIAKTLRLTGLDVGNIHEAADGQEGLDVLEHQWVDLVMCDLNMPVMNGEEMIAHMRANVAWADIPVIVISTEGSQTRIDRLKHDGARFIHKPFAPEAIRDLVVEMLGTPNEQRIKRRCRQFRPTPDTVGLYRSGDIQP